MPAPEFCIFCSDMAGLAVSAVTGAPAIGEASAIEGSPVTDGSAAPKADPAGSAAPTEDRVLKDETADCPPIESVYAN